MDHCQRAQLPVGESAASGHDAVKLVSTVLEKPLETEDSTEAETPAVNSIPPLPPKKSKPALTLKYCMKVRKGVRLYNITV